MDAVKPFEDLTFAPPETGAAVWFQERIWSLARKVRAFELALETVAQSGEVPWAQLSTPMQKWERWAGHVFLYCGLDDGKQLVEEDIPSHAEELEKVYRDLQKQRGVILTLLETAGDSAQLVRSAEQSVQVSEADLRARAGELPPFGE